MGSAFAAWLARGGAEVVLIGRGGAHITAVAERGLRVLGPDRTAWTVPVPCALQAAELAGESLDALIVLTKTFDTTAALAGAAHALAADGVAISLQNGQGNDAALAQVVGGRRALVGVTTVGATAQEPGTISVSGSTAAGASLTQIGALGVAGGADRGADVAAALTACGLPAEHTADIAAAIWAKLALAVMSPISSVVQQTVARVWSHPEGRLLVRRMFDEVVAVAQAQGVTLAGEAAWAHAEVVFDGTGEHYTSMCTDVMRGRRTELADMAGAVRRLAGQCGVEVPVHETVLALLGVLGGGSVAAV